jgi:5-methylcytosine-specific restriction endonuclease McrA
MMNTNIITVASELSDRDLLARLPVLAGGEREATVELLAQLAALDVRPSLYAAEGHGSLFTYCTQVLRLSEDAACNRIHAARACRRFPVLLELLATGALSVTTVRLLREHLTPENHEAVLARASGRSRREIDVLVAELAPRPDVPSSVRKLPTAPSAPSPTLVDANAPAASAPAAVALTVVATPGPERPMMQPVAAARRPIIEPTSPERYRVQFTVGQETHDKLRRLQDLLRREIPDGDPGAIFDRAVAVLLEKVEKQKLGAAARSRSDAIRPGTDSEAWVETSQSRDIPRNIKREAWRRDGGQCAYVAANGQRCPERTFLEFHHIVPHARGGRATLDNISLRCRRHNQYEAELVFGSRGASKPPEHGVPTRERRHASLARLGTQDDTIRGGGGTS